MRQTKTVANVNNEAVISFRTSLEEKAALIELARVEDRKISNMARVLVIEGLKARGVLKGAKK